MALSLELAKKLELAPALTERHARVGDRTSSLADSDWVRCGKIWSDMEVSKVMGYQMPKYAHIIH